MYLLAEAYKDGVKKAACIGTLGSDGMNDWIEWRTEAGYRVLLQEYLTSSEAVAADLRHSLDQADRQRNLASRSTS